MLGKLFIVVFVTILSISSAYSQSRDSIILNKIIYVSKAYIAKNNTDSALKYLTLGKNYFKQSPKALATLLDEEGKVYFSTGNAIKAGSICYEALKIYEELKDSVYISKCYNRLAALNVTQGNANKAVDFFKKAILYNNFKDTSNTFSTYSNMGYMYMNQEKNDSALFYFKKAMPYALTKEHIITIINNIEGTFINLNNIDSAKKYTALREKYLVKNVQEVIMNHEVKGVTFYKQKNYSEAKKQFKAAFDIAKANKKLHSNVEIIQSLSVIYGHLQNTDSAYYYLLKYNAIKDSVYGSENNRKLVELQINHNFEKKRAVELAKQEQQELFYKEKIKRKEITSILLGIAFILAFIILILSYFAYIRKKRVNELLEHKKNIIEQKNTLILDSINYAQQL